MSLYARRIPVEGRGGRAVNMLCTNQSSFSTCSVCRLSTRQKPLSSVTVLHVYESTHIAMSANAPREEDTCWHSRERTGRLCRRHCHACHVRSFVLTCSHETRHALWLRDCSGHHGRLIILVCNDRRRRCFASLAARVGAVTRRGVSHRPDRVHVRHTGPHTPEATAPRKNVMRQAIPLTS